MDGLEVEVHLDESTAPVTAAEVERAVRLVLADQGAIAGEVSVTLVGDAEIARLNRDYLDHEGPTDVISFPLSALEGVTVGDVYIGVDQARRQAEELGVPPGEEVLRLAVHGTLHVLGHDHPETDRDASPMYRLQEELLARVLRDAGGGR